MPEPYSDNGAAAYCLILSPISSPELKYGQSLQILAHLLFSPLSNFIMILFLPRPSLAKITDRYLLIT
jgi:hypothetical protein